MASNRSTGNLGNFIPTVMQGGGSIMLWREVDVSLGCRFIAQYDNGPENTVQTTCELLCGKPVNVIEWFNCIPDLNLKYWKTGIISGQQHLLSNLTALKKLKT